MWFWGLGVCWVESGGTSCKKDWQMCFLFIFLFINIVCNLHHLFLVLFFPPDCCYCIYIIANENGSGEIHSLDTQGSNGLASSRWAVVSRSRWV